MLDMYAFHIKNQKLILSVSLLVTMRILNHTRLRSMWWLGDLLVQVTRQDTSILIVYTSYCHSFTWSFCIKKRKKKSTYRYLLAQSRLQRGIHYPHLPLRWRGHFPEEEGWLPLTPPSVWKLWSCVVCQLWSRLWSQAWSQPWSQSLSLLEILCLTWWNNSLVWVLPLVSLALSLKLKDSC